MATTSRPYSNLAVILVCFLVILADVRGDESEIKPKPRLDGRKLCSLRSGHRQSFIQEVHWRNNDCAIDCVMQQGVVLSYNVKDRTPCHSEGHQCLLGTCRAPDEYVKPDNQLNSVEIKIISAFVEDKDQSPMAGESDVFVMVEVARDGLPTYKNDDDVCFTYIIQDNNRPRWRNFICKPLPMANRTVLRFSAFDSDKPFNEPDRLGIAEETLDYLMNRGPTKLTLVDRRTDGLESPYYIEVEVKGRPYDFDKKDTGFDYEK